MGRALISLLKGEPKNYIMYNIMAIPVAFVFTSELFNARFGKCKKILHVISAIVLTINILYYLFRVIYIF